MASPAPAVSSTASGESHFSASIPPLDVNRLDHLRRVIERAAGLLPAQGPITVFISHNTLQAFEHLPFDEGVQRGARIHGCQPYLLEDQYRDRLNKGRIRIQDLEAVVREDLDVSTADELIAGLVTRYELRMAMLRYPLWMAPESELLWFVAETDALVKFRPETPPAFRQHVVEETRHWVMRDLRTTGEAEDGGAAATERRARASRCSLLQHFGESSIETWSDQTWEAFVLQTLWRVCRDGVRDVPPSGELTTLPTRHRDLLFMTTHKDTDLLVHEVLIRFCAAFLDQGFSQWPLPSRELGFFGSFCAIYGTVAPTELWMRDLPAELAGIQREGLTPLQSIAESLAMLDVPEDDWDEYLTATFLALRGWAGMIRQVEIRSDVVAVKAPEGSLTEFLAVRLILERLAIAHLAAESFSAPPPLKRLRKELQMQLERVAVPSGEQRAFLAFQIAQVCGWRPAQLDRLAKDDWAHLVKEIEAFSSLTRRRLFHQAFERKLRNQTLDAISVQAGKPGGRIPNPRFQTFCCLDDREESFRRHLEEVALDVETFSFAGFYGVAMYFKGVADAHFVPLSPIMIRPRHWVTETVATSLDESNRRRAQTRKVLGAASHQIHLRSRTFFGGALVAALGAMASVPLVGRVLFPRVAANLRKTADKLVQPPSITQLQLERSDSEPGPEGGGVGFSLEEMTDVVERVLRDAGLTGGFARIVLLFGHGSYSQNNPHKSAYDCGACGGSSGGPNSRVWAHLANDPRVRERLLNRGIVIPDTTIFVGALHNTCNDEVVYSDLDRIPATHLAEFQELRRIVEEACERNAHERCRRFASAPLNMTFKEARRHVEERSEDLAQPRPECGHATNAVCFVGRRQRTRGLFMDRRTFLTSYDPTQDDTESSILTRILSAAIPVCGGINLQYYFSHVDSTGWGCGTKLPHNVTSLIGVMDGAASDLRTGMPWQAVEIHEPVRLLFVVETTPEKMTAIMDRNRGIAQPLRNDWLQLATLDPHSNQIHLLRNGCFEPYAPETTELPTAETSAAWYRGWREHLDYAVIRRGELPITGRATTSGGSGLVNSVDTLQTSSLKQPDNRDGS